MYPNYRFYPYGASSMASPMYQGIEGAPMRGGLGSLLGLVKGRSAGMGNILPKAKFNWGNLLSNTQKTLGVINQAIPIFYQIRPMWNNAKVMFNVMNAVKDDGSKKPSRPSSPTYRTQETNNFENTETPSSTGTGPTFFL